MAVHASHAGLPYPVKKARYSFYIPYMDADGDPTVPTTPDTEISKDNAAAADCTEEVSATSGMDGSALMTLTGDETNCSAISLMAKVASGPKFTPIHLYPRVLPILATGQLAGGSAGGGTLGTVLVYDLTGCIIRTTGGLGGGGGSGSRDNQARQIMTYNTTTGEFTVEPDWETTPDSTTTYDILCTEMACNVIDVRNRLPPTLSSTGGILADMQAISRDSVAADNLEAALDGTGGVTFSVILGTGAIALGSFAANSITDTAIATSAILEIQSGLAVSATALSNVQWTNTRATNLDNLDATISSRRAPITVDGKTEQQAFQIIAAMCGGRISGAGTGTEVFLGLDEATTRVTVTVDSSGNRTDIVYG